MKSEICVILICWCFGLTIGGKCPASNVLLPCSCENDEIYCSGDTDYNLRNVFVAISANLTGNDKHFKSFHFDNPVINELVANVLVDITFEDIFIDAAYKLTKINKLAFNSTNSFVKRFRVFDTPIVDTISEGTTIFDAINSMVNIERIRLHNTSITSIPSKAFSALNKLKTILIYANDDLKSIGINAFYELNHLTTLYLTANPIDLIPDQALSFRNANNTEKLNIYFDMMPNLTSKSFSVSAFTTINRPFVLYLKDNLLLTYLDENTFAKVLSNGNTIDLDGTPLECDCRMYWLYGNKAQYEKLVLNSVCISDGKSVFTDRQKFNGCKI